MGLILGSYHVQAQKLTGKKGVGLSFSMISDDDKTSEFSSDNKRVFITPNLSYFLNDRWAIGLRAGFSRTKSNRNRVDSITHSHYRRGMYKKITLFATYYHWYSKKSAFFVEPSLDFTQTTFQQEVETDNHINKTDHSIQSYSIDTRVGYLLLISPKFSIDFSAHLLGISHNKNNFRQEFIQNDTSSINHNETSSYHMLFSGGKNLSFLMNLQLSVKYLF